MKRLRILHTEASLGWGGQEIRILTEMQGMAARGHELTLLAPETSHIFSAAQKRGLHAEALPIGRKNLTGLLALRRWLKQHPVDIINTHSSSDTWLAALACASLSVAPPLVRTRHISAPVPNNMTSRWLYRRATAYVVTTGEKLRQQLIREVGLAADKVESVPTGIDLDLYSPGDSAAARAALGLDPQRFIVGIVATLRSWKGHRYLVDALAKLPQDIMLVIVGDGPQRNSLTQQVNQSGLNNRVVFTGNREDVTSLMQAFDLFVLPSYANEGVPQALMQAMACGLPVISTPVGSIAEIITDNETGLLVEPQQVEALRQAIAHLAQDSAQRTRLGAQALTRARERFGEARMVDRMQAIFQRVIDSSPR